MNMSPEAVEMRKKLAEERRAAKRTGKVHPDTVFLSEDEMKAALRTCRGHMTNAAKSVGVSSFNFRKKVFASDELREYYYILRDEFVDTAEYKLMELVEDGNLGAVIFTLKTLGKSRGYVEKSTLEHEIAPKMNNAAGLIEAMRQGAIEGPTDASEEAISVEVRVVDEVDSGKVEF